MFIIKCYFCLLCVASTVKCDAETNASITIKEENNQGYVVALTESAEAKNVVDAENADRKVVYQTIADQNGLSGEVATIEKVFGQVQRDKAQTGYKIQLEDGSWSVK